MSNRERAAQLLDNVPDYKLDFVIAYLLGVTAGENIPNDETISAMRELENGGGETFSGSTEDADTCAAGGKEQGPQSGR